MRAALVAIQLEIDAEILASPDAYRAHLEAECERALSEGGGDRADARLVVFPEIAGHLALYALAPPAARRAKTLGSALAASAVRRPFDVLRGLATTRLLDGRHAVLAALAPDGERWWKSVFGPLAKEHAAYIVAGSYLRLHADGSLTNASITFGPDGRLLSTTDKVNLVPGLEDGARGALALARGDANVPIVDTPMGRLATLICYDAFREPHTRTERFIALGPRLADRGVDIIANPAANPWPWRAAWKFNEDGESLTRDQQWDLEGMCGSLRQIPFATYGITAHLVGHVLDLAFEGTSEVVERSGAEVRLLGRAQAHDRGGHVTAVVTC